MDRHSEPDTTVVGEETPLIDHGQYDAPKESPNHPYRTQVLVITFLSLIIMDWAGSLGSAPQLDIFEGIICDNIYGEGSASAVRDCTIDAVQSELATVAQILSATNEIPSIFVAIPYGALADRIGRRPVLFLSLVGLLAQEVIMRFVTWWPAVFPLRLVWAVPLTTLVGGGSTVASAMLYLAVNDVIAEHERSAWFSRMLVAVLSGEIAAASTASALMRWYGPWMPYLLGPLVFALSIPLIIWFPETSQTINTQDHQRDDEDSPKSTGEQFKLIAQRTAHSLGIILKDWNLVIIILSYFVTAIVRNASLDTQFMHQRFKWKFSSVRSPYGRPDPFNSCCRQF
jgi:MFS family permease